MCQNQEVLPDKYSMCGLFSVNNALQQRDFLTPAAMRSILSRLSQVRPSEDHGDPRYGAFAIDALQKALQRQGKQLRFMNTTSGFKSRDKRPVRLFAAGNPLCSSLGRVRVRLLVPGTALRVHGSETNLFSLILTCTTTFRIVWTI
ncbi:hypothetical protein PF011_g9176 [Phytophthora fragariae]|uniref:Uncharacterized protein n=1 Tax=Phytophthora fragariae TaxID=53985 RepID=A0A6A3KYG8_9STRA|nr:hypothetical protein PF003_g39338 [Phytophthora fragariae]KAE9011860.1 hypothetical protein PF011_g9176 [Phytophthora fragariae]